MKDFLGPQIINLPTENLPFPDIVVSHQMKTEIVPIGMLIKVIETLTECRGLHWGLVPL